MPGARGLEPESLHVTLCFLGEHLLQDVPEIARACRVLACQPRVMLTLGPVLWLPDKRPRALAVGLEDDNPALGRLQSTLSRALQAGGWYRPQRRRFLGHVTVARIAAGTALPVPAVPMPSPLRFISAAVTLYRSHLAAGGARYQPLETVGLNG